jgi:hypothetical protein
LSGVAWILFGLGALCAGSGISQPTDPVDPRRLDGLLRLGVGSVMMVLAVALETAR